MATNERVLRSFNLGVFPCAFASLPRSSSLTDSLPRQPPSPRPPPAHVSPSNTTPPFLPSYPDHPRAWCSRVRSLGSGLCFICGPWILGCQVVSRCCYSPWSLPLTLPTCQAPPASRSSPCLTCSPMAPPSAGGVLCQPQPHPSRASCTSGLHHCLLCVT